MPKDILNYNRHEYNDEDELPGEDLLEYEENPDYVAEEVIIHKDSINIEQAKENFNDFSPTIPTNTGMSIDHLFKKEEIISDCNNLPINEELTDLNSLAKVKELNAIPIEKSSLFEKDFTLMFLSDNKRNSNTQSHKSFSQSHNQSQDFSFDNHKNSHVHVNVNLPQNFQNDGNFNNFNNHAHNFNNNNFKNAEQNLFNNFDDIFVSNPNKMNGGNFNNTKNSNNPNNSKYSNLNPESEIQLNLNSDFEAKRRNMQGVNMNPNMNMGMNMNPNMGMNPNMSMGMNKNPNMNPKMNMGMNNSGMNPMGMNAMNMNPMNMNMNMGGIKSPQQMLMQPFLLPFPNMNPQFEPNMNPMNMNAMNMNMNGMNPNSNSNANFDNEEEDMTNLLENPVNIVQKNITKRGWFLMAEKDKIMGNFNSIDLLSFLDEKFRSGFKFEGMWLTDYDTDIYFTPTNLYEILKENLPKIIDQIKNKKKNMNMGNMNMMPNMMPKVPMRIGNMPFPDPIMPPMNMMPPFDPRMNFNKNNMDRSTTPPMNMNINLQVVKNSINLNNIMLPPHMNNNNFGMPVPDFII